jgi:hypothetical protein
MRTTLRTTTIGSGAAAIALVLLAQGAFGQGATVGVRIVAVKATVLPVGGERPAIPEDLEPFTLTLSSVPLAEHSRYELLGESTKRAAPGTPLTFVFPRDHQAAVVVAVGRGERPFNLSMEITRPAPPPKQTERERVLLHEVSIEDGATYVVRVVDALGKDEHLLLLVTAGTK